MTAVAPGAGGYVPPPPPEPDQKQERKTLAAAADGFREAQELAPDNLAVTMRLCAVLERQNQYVEALARYLGFQGRWKRVYEVRYRIAATLGMSAGWLGSMAEKEQGPARRELAARLRERKYEAAALLVENPSPAELHGALLSVAEAEWRSLDRFLGWPRSLGRFAIAVVRHKRQWNDAAYQRRFIRPWGARFELHRAIKVVTLATEIQCLAPWPQPYEPERQKSKIDALRKKVSDARGSTQEIQYNRACCYARLYEVAGDQRDVDCAMECLKHVMQSGNPSLWLTTIHNDPDLDSLRRTPEFHEWWRGLNQADSEISAETWVIEVAVALAERWETVAKLETCYVPPPSVATAPTATPADAPETRRINAMDADEACFDALVAWAMHPDRLAADGQAAHGDVQRSAAGLHVRIPMSPNADARACRLWATPRFLGVAEPKTLSGHIQALKVLPADTSDAGARGKRWRNVVSVAASFFAVHDDDVNDGAPSMEIAFLGNPQALARLVMDLAALDGVMVSSYQPRASEETVASDSPETSEAGGRVTLSLFSDHAYEDLKALVLQVWSPIEKEHPDASIRPYSARGT
jgi:hypothetical protein